MAEDDVKEDKDSAQEPPAEGSTESMFSQAMDALRKYDRTRARDLLTRLIKVDQENATYWVWLSAAVDTHKERAYCLETALRFDPENAAAKRGLMLLGKRPPDGEIKPFSLNRPRLWEERYKIQEPKVSALRKPLIRLALIVVVGLVGIGMVLAGFFIPSSPLAAMRRSPTPFNYRTASPTATRTPEFRTATPTFIAPTPLWMLLPATYTPTPLYVATQHPVTSRDAFDAGLRYMRNGDYQNAIVLMEQILTLEPNAADAWYYIGECQRMLGNQSKALQAYQSAIDINPGFGPAFLGRALARQGLGQTEGVEADLDRAVSLDPGFALAHTYRGAYYYSVGSYAAALSDLNGALSLTPDSALAYLYLAQTQLALGQNSQALASALQANTLDSTMLETYLVLGEAYKANGQPDKALGALQTYTLYRPDNPDAMAYLGAAYNARGDYNQALFILDRAIAIDKNHVEANYQRGYAYLNLGMGTQAVHDFRIAVGYDPTHFDAAVGLARAFDLNGFPGNAYIQMEAALGLAKNPSQRAIAYYYEAIFLEKTNDPTTARVKWLALLSLPENAMPAEWRITAMDRLGVTPTATRFATTTPVLYLTTSTPTRTP